MKKSDALKAFPTQRALADALGIRTQTISTWGKFVPYHWQPVLEKLRPGILKAMQPREYAEYRKKASA